MRMLQGLRVARIICLGVFLCFALTGCLTTKMYVDPALPHVSKTDLKQSAKPGVVQVLFEFRTKGNANAKATEALRSRIVAVAAESGLFNGVSATPGIDGGGILKVVIDNVAPDDQHEIAKGVGTGLTLGLAGSLVTDGYICNATYSRDGKVYETVVKHALHTTIGNHSAPAGMTALDPQTAIHQVIDQLAWNALKQLSEKGAFE